MKLKKIASLALAGVMAVSMLAGCKYGEGSSNDSSSSEPTTPSTSYTETVLAATNAATQAKLSASTNEKLDKAVAWAAQMDRSSNKSDALTLTSVPAGWNMVGLAEEYMTGSTTDNDGDLVYDGNPAGWSFDVNSMSLWNNSDRTYWTLFYVGGTVSDEYITNEVAAYLDNMAKTMENKGEVVEHNNANATYDYTVSVSKAVCAGADLDTKSDDFVIIGLAVTTDKTGENY